MNDDEGRMRLDRAWWDERMALHLAGEFYDVAGSWPAGLPL